MSTLFANAFADPTEWWLELPSHIQTEIWQQSQGHATPQSRWNAYLNQLSLQGILNWMQTDYDPTARAWLDARAIAAIWEVVNGSVITVGSHRLAVIPTDEIASNELDVPQEWVDIPSWAADYYLATQVDVDTNTVRVWGYASHQDLKTQGHYDASDRTYSLAADQLTRNLNTLWATLQWCSEAQTKAEIFPLSDLSTVQAENLIQRLSPVAGDGAIPFPRLAVPFSLWGGLMVNSDWRQQLYQRRITGTSRICLSQWLRGTVDGVWQAIEAVLSPEQVAGAWRNHRDVHSPLSNPLPVALFDISRAKLLEFRSQPDGNPVALVIGVSALNDMDVMVGIQINPVGDRDALSHGIQVRLLDETGSEIGQASATVTETIRFQFSGSRGDRFSIEVTQDDQSITEPFEI